MSSGEAKLKCSRKNLHDIEKRMNDLVSVFNVENDKKDSSKAQLQPIVPPLALDASHEGSFNKSRLDRFLD